MLLIFGGTTEGRLAASVCEEAGKPFYYSTKSGKQDVEMHNGVHLSGAMTSADIKQFCHAHSIRCIIDAAHPFAENLHKEIANAEVPVVRIQRQRPAIYDNVCYCDGYDDAVNQLQNADVHCLLALSGVNTIAKLKPYWTQHKTIFRILNREESITIAQRQSLPEESIIYYNDNLQLPTKDEEIALLRSVGCDAIITKESGTSGGFEQKVEAALSLGLRVFVVKAPQLPYNWTYVTGKYGLRRAIEQCAPDFFPMKIGFTTGACAAAATKAALISLLGNDMPVEVSFALPDGEIMNMQVHCEDVGTASAIKDFSDDPDVTKGCKITAHVALSDDGKVTFLQGKGVGVVTLPGLGIPVGEPAINPTPREMIANEVLALAPQGAQVTISVENGEEIAKHTFNPKVGVIGGISIIGTSGIVKPLSNEAFVQSIRRELEVARAIGCTDIGLVAGMKSEQALAAEIPDLRCIHYGNFIGDSLTAAHELGFKTVYLAIMIGKAVKLAEGHLNTHSHQVQMNKEFLISVAKKSIKPITATIAPIDTIAPIETIETISSQINSVTMARELWRIMPQTFFAEIERLCLMHCRKAFPNGNIIIKLIRNDKD